MSLSKKPPTSGGGETNSTTSMLGLLEPSLAKQSAEEFFFETFFSLKVFLFLNYAGIFSLIFTLKWWFLNLIFIVFFLEQDLCFTMPLCLSKMEQVTTEDLVELSEIQKQNLGQVYIYIFFFIYHMYFQGMSF